jgi:hypothetical protein
MALAMDALSISYIGYTAAPAVSRQIPGALATSLLFLVAIVPLVRLVAPLLLALVVGARMRRILLNLKYHLFPHVRSVIWGEALLLPRAILQRRPKKSVVCMS